MRRWQRRQELKREAEANARMGAVMGFALVDHVHNNRTGQNYHPTCVPAFAATRDLVELGDLPGEKTCAGCGQAI